jgi:hypothetical protein
MSAYFAGSTRVPAPAGSVGGLADDPHGSGAAEARREQFE